MSSKYDYLDPGQDPAYCDGLGHTALADGREHCVTCRAAYVEPAYPLSYWPYCSRRCELQGGDTRVRPRQIRTTGE